ncbi:MAG: HSP90 family protein [Planctomycetota bacterium]
MDEHRFQIHLGGIIDLLSNHLYSGPQVYVRELLQNGVDAIRARRRLEPGHAGRIELEVLGGERPTLLCVDDGVGLTPEEVHAFLATIGESSKRGELALDREDYLGQFGIGLLSCFLVSEEIVLITRSARPGSPALEWRGRPDGTYALRTLEREAAPGTQVYLRARPGCEDWLARERVEELVRHFGGLLGTPIVLRLPEGERALNDARPPWRAGAADPQARRRELLQFGQALLRQPFWDAIPLAGEGFSGVAYVLPFQPTLATQGTHRVYLKGMLVSESAENLLPRWAFFVKCIVDSQRLHPTASREALYEDEELERTRARLAELLRDWLVRLAREEPERWRAFLALHSLTIRALALQDDELFELFVERLPFETTMGRLTLAEVRELFGAVRYVTQVEAFRQIRSVCAAQGLCVVNGGYVYLADILERYAARHPALDVLEVDPQDLSQSFAPLSDAEEAEVAGFRALADEVLAAHDCRAELRRFQPRELPTLYTTDREALFRRSLERTREEAQGAWGGVLDDLAAGEALPAAQLCFNYDNPLVRRLVARHEPALVRRVVELLYVQSLLLGQHPLRQRELALLSDGLLGLIDWGMGRA